MRVVRFGGWVVVVLALMLVGLGLVLMVFCVVCIIWFGALCGFPGG